MPSWDDFPIAPEPAAPAAQPAQADPWAAFPRAPEQAEADPWAAFPRAAEPAAAPASFDAWRANPENQAAAQRIIRAQTGRDVDGPAALGELETRMGWGQGNTLSAGRRLLESREADDETKADMARLQQDFNDLPDFWQRGGRGLHGFAENLTAGVIDPINLVGGVIGKGLGAVATRVGAPAVGRALGSQAGRIGVTAGVDALGGVGANLAQQGTENELGMRQGYSLGEAAVSGLVSGVASGAGNAAVNYRPGRSAARTSTGVPEADAMLANKAGPDADAAEHGTHLNTVQRQYQEFADFALPARELAGELGKGRNIREMSRASTAGAVDPTASSYAQFRGMPGAVERVRQTMDKVQFLPPEIGARLGTAESGYNRVVGEGLNRILEAAEKAYGVSRAFIFETMDAGRAVWIRDVRNPHLMAEAFDNHLRQQPDYQRIFSQLTSLGNPNADARALAFVRTQAGPGTPLHAAATKVAEAAKIGLGKFEDASAFLPGTLDAAASKAAAANSPDAILAAARAQPWYADVIPKLHKFHDNNLEYTRRSSVISQQAMDAMRGVGVANPNNIEFFYSPWYHEAGGAGGKGGVAGMPGSPVKQKLTGAMGNLQDGQRRHEAYVSRLITSSDMNRATLAYVDEALQAQSQGLFGGKIILKPLRDQKVAAMLAREQAAKSLDKLGLPVTARDELDIQQASILAERRGKASSGETRKISVYRDGKMEVYEILDTAHAAMFDALAPEDLNKYWQAARGFGRIKADLITNSPPFIFWNAAMDTASSGINSPHGFLPVVDTLRGYGTLIRGTRMKGLNPLYSQQTHDMILEARRSGIGFAGRNHMSQLAETGGDFTAPHRDGLYGSVRDWMANSLLGRGWGAWAELNNQLEMAPRLMEYKRARAAGMSGPGAGLAGREVATDFARHGSNQSFRHLAGMTTFLNASLQGMDRTWRAILHESGPAKLAIITTAFVMPPLVLHGLNNGHETYEAINPDQRRKAAWIPNPVSWAEYRDWLSGAQTEFVWRDGNKHPSPEAEFIAVPLPEAVGSVVSAINGIVDYIRTGNGDAVAEGFLATITANMPGMHLPDLAQPVFDLWTGKDGLGRPITPAGLEGVDPVNQRTASTPEWAVSTAELIKKITGGLRGEGREGVVPLTPIEIDFLAKSLLPGIGTIFMQAGSQLTRNPVTEGARTEARAEEFDASRPWTMVTRRFAREGNNPSSEPLNQLYEIADRASKVERAELNAQRDPLQALRQNGRDRPSTEEREALRNIAGPLQAFREALSQYRSGIQLIDHDTQSATPAERRKQMDALVATRDDAVRIMLDVVRKDAPVLLRTWLNPHPEDNTPENNTTRQLFGRPTQERR